MAEQGKDGGTTKAAECAPRRAHKGRMRQTNMAIVYVARRRGQHGLCHAQSPAHVLLCATVCACAAVRYRMRARPAARVHSYEYSPNLNTTTPTASYSVPRGSDPRWFQRVFRVAPGFRQGGAEVCGAIRRKTRPPTGSTSPESRSSVSIHTAARQVRVTPHHSALPCSA